MAPIKSSKSKGSKSAASSRKPGAKKPTGSAPTGISKKKAKSLKLAKPGGAQKTKSAADKASANKKKKKVYTEKELGIPQLNGIIPAGVEKPKGQKKGKKFVEDPAQLMAIMHMVNAEKEGDIESKLMRARQLEEVREARRKEQEARSDEKKAKFEETKNSLRKKNKHKGDHKVDADFGDEPAQKPKADKKKKRVSFG